MRTSSRRKRRQMRSDGAYENVFMSVGSISDRSSYTTVKPGRRLGPQQLESLYVYDGIARRIVDLPAEELTRSGYYIEGIPQEEEVRRYLEKLNFTKNVTDALRWAGLYGGSMIVLLINDGRSFEEELDFENIKDIEQIRVYDKEQVSWTERYEDPNDKRFGKVKIYQISPSVGVNYNVHESRCFLLDGSPVPNSVREENDGWGVSRLQQCFDNMLRFGMTHVWANALLERAQQAVHSIPGLTNLLRAPDGEALVKKRVNLVDMTRSINNTVVIDADEGYDLKSTPFAGIADIMDRQGLSLTCVTGIPECLFYGRQQGGLNGNGDADLQNWFAKMAQEKATTLDPLYTWTVGIALKAMGKTEDFSIKFNPMRIPSQKEVAEAEWRDAQTFAIYQQIGAMDRLEIRNMLPSKGYYIDETKVPEIPTQGAGGITNTTDTGKQKVKGPLIGNAD